MTCKRCGAATPRHTLTQRYCEPCKREVERLTAKPERTRPTWFERLTPKDMSGARA